jgi:hypothetical protein
MAYFIYPKDVNNSILKIVEHSEELNNLNIVLENTTIIEDTQNNFINVVLGKKIIVKHENNKIVYKDQIIDPVLGYFTEKKDLDQYISIIRDLIKQFLDRNTNNPLYSKWNSYYTQLSSVDTNSINYPLNTSLEEYFYNQNLPALSPLQIP